MDASQSFAIESERFTRHVGSVRGRDPGPTLIVVGGIHGNEPAGLRAARRVLDRLERDDAGLRGEVLVLGGNLAALRLRRRYQVKDLNRQWSDERLAELRRTPADALDAEDREQLELLAAIEDAMARSRGPVHVLDLHTTSAAGFPFVLFGDTLRQRRFGFSFPLPVILGLEEQVDGVLSGYFTQRGCVAVSIEGGQHDDPASVDNLTACLWVALVAAGLVDRRRLPEHDGAYGLLEARRGTLPAVMEVTRRWAITPEDQFRMAPGFANLDRARRGQLLARDVRGEIRADEDGMVILPLYQGLGNEGFFWGREVGATRLALAERVRRLRLDRALTLLPGVRRDPTHPDRLRANTRIARLYPLDVFHVFGYRRIREVGHELVVARQPQ
jgi:succinylglutamate desuccinylase